MPGRVVIEDQGDCWWQGPSAVECDVCWEKPGRLLGPLDKEGRYWLLRLTIPMYDRHRMADFEYVMVPADRLDLSGNRPVSGFSVPMYPVLRRVEPGEHVSFDGEVLAGVKATIRRS